MSRSPLRGCRRSLWWGKRRQDELGGWGCCNNEGWWKHCTEFLCMLARRGLGRGSTKCGAKCWSRSVQTYSTCQKAGLTICDTESRIGVVRVLFGHTVQMNPNPAPPKLYSAYYEWRNELVWAGGPTKWSFFCSWWSNTLAVHWSTEPPTVVYLIPHLHIPVSYKATRREKSKEILWKPPKS